MFLSKIMPRLISRNLALGICLVMGAINSIDAYSSGIITFGDAAVTAFSGTANQNPNIIFDNKGPSLRVITLPGSGAFGFKNVLHPFTATSGRIGQVFGIALDDAPQPNIYVSATSAYGLAIYKPNVGRLKRGDPGAQFMPGQFGPADQGGGPGSIWRIDGVNGKITLFANVVYNGIENNPAALGGLAFDPKTKQLFVADRTTGMIHRFALDGVDMGVFDHGVQGLTMIGREAVPFDPTTIAKISNSKFDTENPKTWGFAPEPRRVFALAVYGQRLYYSVYGAQIWSVGIGADGSFVDDVRLEVESPVAQQDIEISSITFDALGYMYLAERGAPTGDYDFINVAHSGQSRVKRFTPKKPTESSPFFWESPGENYAIGMSPDYQNADGGVTVTCGRTLWATGDRLLDTGASESDLHINGLQGNDKDLVRPANVPPIQSWFVNYYDHQSNPNSRGYMGALVNRSLCLGYTPPAIPSGFTCSKGTCLVDGFCFVSPVCPGGTVFQEGYCVYPNCPWGFVRIRGECVFPPIVCDYGTVFIEGYCVPLGCPPGLEWAPYGYCHCPDSSYYTDGHCTPPPPCPSGERYRDGRCIPEMPCPPYLTYQDGYCYPQYPCLPNQFYRNGHCTPSTLCPPEQMYRNGICMPTIPCPPGQTYRNNRCTPENQCPPGERFQNGHCNPITQTPPSCPDGQVYRGGRCIIIVVDPIPRRNPNPGINVPTPKGHTHPPRSSYTPPIMDHPSYRHPRYPRPKYSPTYPKSTD